MSLPGGMRRNNPGNLRDVGIPWRGMAGSDGGFCVFGTLADGLRAFAIDLCNAQRKHDRMTIRGIVSAYAPPSENQTSEYIANVCADVDVGPDEIVHLEWPPRLAATMKAMIRQEQGLNAGAPWVSGPEIAAAVEEAYEAVGWPVNGEGV